MLLSDIVIYTSEKIAGDINFTLLKENKIKTLPNKYLNYINVSLTGEQAAEFYENNVILFSLEENLDIANLDFYNALGVRLHIGSVHIPESTIGPVDLLLHRAESDYTMITFEAFGPDKLLSNYYKNVSPYYYYTLQTSGYQIEIRRYPIDLTNFSNEAGYIKKDVSNLVNYYKKSDTYSKAEINNLIPEKYIEISLPSFISLDELYEGTITTEQLNQLKADSLIAIKVVIAEETVQYLLPHFVYENTENNFQAKYVQIGWDSGNEIFTNTIDINNTNFAYGTKLNLIPFKTSHLENDSNFIINTVDNLTNYYKKTETYTQTEINNFLNAITTLDIQVATSKPESPNKTTIYLIGTGTDGNNDYEEWLYTDSGWELIGTTAVDLSNYYNKTEADEQFAKLSLYGDTTINVGRKRDSTIGGYSTAEGYDTTASEAYSHAEGFSTVASDSYTHAEGLSTVASGQCAHAEGFSTVASGSYSHAEGNKTIASGHSSHAQGRYNISDTTYLHVVGNGTADDARSNAHTIDWYGNAWFSGDVYVKSTSGTNKDEGSKKLAIEENHYTKTETDDLLNSINGVNLVDPQPYEEIV